jgi:hypothetical protein
VSEHGRLSPAASCRSAHAGLSHSSDSSEPRFFESPRTANSSPLPGADAYRNMVFYEDRNINMASASFQGLIIDTLCQMMYVSGETTEPSVETTSIIEDIVRQQVIELVSHERTLKQGRTGKTSSR